MRMMCPLLVAMWLGVAPIAAQSPSGLSGRQAYLFEALDRWGADLSIAVIMHQDPYPEARLQMARVLASNPDPADLPLLRYYQTDTDSRVREQVMLAAGRLGKPALDLALQGLADPSPRVRRTAAWAACHAGSDAWEALSKVLAVERDPAVLENLLANLWRLEGVAWQPAAAKYASNDDPYLRRAAAYSLSRTDDAAAREAQRRLAVDAEPVIRATALRGLARGTLGEQDLKVVIGALDDQDWRVPAAACGVLAAQDAVALPPAAARTVASAFASPHPHLAAAALAAAVSQPAIGSAEELARLARGDDSWLATEALAALAAREPETAAGIAGGWQASPEDWRRRAAARVAAKLGPEAEARAAADGDAGVRLAWLGSLDDEQVIERRARLLAVLEGDADAAVRAQVLMLLRGAGGAPTPDQLLGYAAAWREDAMPDARAEALLGAFAAAETETARQAAVDVALADRDPVVAAMLVNGARALGRELTLPRREPRHGKRWYAELVEWMAEPRWLDVVTDRGSFRIRLDLDNAPLTSREIWDLAAAGFYDGLDVHRVVPNFVVQGGDPRGDGWGGPGFALPDEPSLEPFDSWRVGIATSGPQTGGCQLFVTLLPADHLTGHYTNFGEVVAGRNVLTAIRVGDRIRRVRAVSGAEPPPLAASIEAAEAAPKPTAGS